MYNLVIIKILQHFIIIWISESSVFTNQAALDAEIQNYNSFHNQTEMYETDLQWKVLLLLQAYCFKLTKDKMLRMVKIQNQHTPSCPLN